MGELPTPRRRTSRGYVDSAMVVATNLFGPSSVLSSLETRRMQSCVEVSAADMKKVTTGSNAVQVSTAFFRHQVDGKNSKGGRVERPCSEGAG